LPEWFIARYSKYFEVNLRIIRIAESRKVNGSNAMTDCMNIYFPMGRLSDVVSKPMEKAAEAKAQRLKDAG